MAWWKSLVVCLGTAAALALVGALSVLSIKAGAPTESDPPDDVRASIVGVVEQDRPPPRHPRGHAGPGDPTYAAVAVNKQEEKAYGYAFDFATRRAAERRALRECQARSDAPEKCRAVAFVRDGCLAVTRARRDNGTIYRIAVGTARRCNPAQVHALGAAPRPSLVLVAVSSEGGPVQ